jgi:prenylcysteine alpha-carboxyl methylesterase
MSIPEAIKGAQAELSLLQNPVQRLKRVVVYARIIAAEVVGTLAVLPYAWRAWALHRSLPDATASLDADLDSTSRRRGDTVSMLRDVRYGNAKRELLDVYLPPSLTKPLPKERSTSSDPPALPAVMFVHGGVWASGDKWHYSPLATRLAQAGVIAIVVQYSLYPHAGVQTMVGEVNRALTWVLDEATRLGADPRRVSLVGHSAGAHLGAMALLHRALEGRGRQRQAGAGGGNNGDLGRGRGEIVKKDGGSREDAFVDVRMPARFVGMAGVYDIGKHLEWEEGLCLAVHFLCVLGGWGVYSMIYRVMLSPSYVLLFWFSQLGGLFFRKNGKKTL